MSSMVDNPELIEQAEDDLNRLVMIFHRSGLNYWQILGLLLELCLELYQQADAEYWQKQCY